MQWRLWWWTKVRRTEIPPDERQILERFGETLIQLALVGGLQPGVPEITDIYNNTERREYALRWLAELHDLRELREQRLETAEWSILVFVVLGVVIDFMLLFGRHPLLRGQ